MKIIKEGKTTEQQLWIGQCSKCKAIVEAKQHELIDIQSGDYRSDNEDWVWGDCPCCFMDKPICFHKEGSKSANRTLNQK